ncbi:TetR/AcrR family transcriptional regulator C-terminal domain-containing protein [Microvirga sp. Marseille-Q2068]|uniref:TetR/AcrR family transcriptional regulator C-terminal domain-containing protein n=1 Tax=Microvirga mediterraneensis TaxID=2754695 RepID=A0A838BVL1_9HYPH|nr:TetR/AcrR family transcriptional regulator C-terminal domain-containing protein [Microvirga mediterraneensis]
MLLDGIAAGQHRQLDVRFAAEQFFSSVILGGFHRVLIGLELPDLNYVRKRHLQKAVDLFLRGCGPEKV